MTRPYAGCVPSMRSVGSCLVGNTYLYGGQAKLPITLMAPMLYGRGNDTELGIDLDLVVGTGPGGRVTEDGATAAPPIRRSRAWGTQ